MIKLNETPVEVSAVGTVYFQPISRGPTYFHKAATHSQDFRFDSDGKEYWGTVRRYFDREGISGERVSTDVELYVRNSRTRMGRLLPETAKALWRLELRKAFRDNIDAFLAAEEAAHRAKVEAAEETPACLNCGAPDLTPEGKLCRGCRKVESIRIEYEETAEVPAAVAKTPAAEPAVLNVTCSHSSERWTLTEQPFSVIARGGPFSDYRVGGDAENGFYAIAPSFGCGRNAATPERAIRSLLESNGAQSIRVNPAPAMADPMRPELNWPAETVSESPVPSISAAFEELEAPAPRPGFLVYVEDGREGLCEGGVFADVRDAIREAETAERNRKGTVGGTGFYNWTDDAADILPPDSTVLSSLEPEALDILYTARPDLRPNAAPPSTADIPVVETIDLTPTWSAVVPILAVALESGTEEGRKAARAELKEMARAADRWNAATQVQPVAIVPDPDALETSFLISGNGWSARVYAERMSDGPASKHYLTADRDGGGTEEIYESRATLAEAIRDAVSLCSRDGRWPAHCYPETISA